MRRLSYVVLVACVITVGVHEHARADGYGYEPAPSSTPYSWRGFYLGAHVGGAWGSTDAYDSGGVITLSDYWSAAPSGVVAGLQLGYNWLAGPVLYGLEGDLGYLGLAGSATTTYVPLGYDTSTQTDSDFYLTLRARLGVIINKWALLYATGGYIGTDTTVSILGACDAALVCSTPTVGGSNSSFRSGWTLGGGLEGELGQDMGGGAWTAKVEYLYYDLGSTSVTTNIGGAINTWTLETDGSLVRAGLNYRFGGPN
jgi:outer membrane immunogenic protein